MENQELHTTYFASLSEKERKALQIAETHLGILFNLEKTNGYQQWLQKQSNASKVS
jgi:hypothetical protein